MNSSHSTPLVSIIVPAFNREDTLRETLDSCLAQTYPNVEVIVVNDGSTDSTRAVAESYGSRIRLVNQSNSGLAGARNAGHAIARGDFVAWMDADDIAHPARIEIEMAVLRSHPRLSLVCSDFSAFLTGHPDHERSHLSTYYGSFRNRGGASALFPARLEVEVPAGEFGTRVPLWVGPQFRNLIFGNFVHPPTVLARKSVLDDAGVFDTTLKSASDYELILRLANRGDIGLVDLPLLRYRRGSHQMSGSFVNGETWSEYRGILDRVQRVEPQLFEENKESYRLAVARSYVWEARTLCDRDRTRAMRLVFRSLGVKVLPRLVGETLAYIFVPGFLISAARWSKRVIRPRSVGNVLSTEGIQLATRYLRRAFWAVVVYTVGWGIVTAVDDALMLVP
jgi:glycosyltransferase involved in cell wall biosynthesis